MRVDDGGSSTATAVATPPQPAQTPAAPASSSAGAATAVAPSSDSISTSDSAATTGSSGGQGAASSATWPGGPDHIDLSGTSGPERKLLLEDQRDAASSGTFNDGASGVSPQEQKLAQSITSPLRNDVQNGQTPNPNDIATINQYVFGQNDGLTSTAPQRLQNVMSALGPQGTQQWLQSASVNMSDGDYKTLSNSFNQLVSSGQLSTNDARQLVDGQVAQNTGSNFSAYANTVSGLVSGLGNDPNSVAFKNAYAQQSLTQAGMVGQNGSRFERTQLYAQASQVLDATPNDDSAKRAAFEQMTGDADALRAAGSSAADRQSADQIDAYALDTLGHASPDAISAELRSYGAPSVDSTGNFTPGSIDSNGNIAQGSKLSNLIDHAIAGQASFNGNIPPSGAFPDAISSTLESLSQGSDKQLTQGVLSNVLQNFQQNPGQAKAFQQLDSSLQTGLPKSMSDALNSSFDQFVGRNGAPGFDSGQQQDLATLTQLENSSSYQKGNSGNFDAMVQSHASDYSGATANSIMQSYYSGAVEDTAEPPPNSISEARSLASGDGKNLPALNMAATQLASYVSQGNSADDRANRLEKVKEELGNDPTGQHAFLHVLENAQTYGAEFKSSGLDPNLATNVQGAFQTLVNRGSITQSDVRNLVDQQAQQNASLPYVDPKAGAPIDTLSSKYDGLGDYFKGLVGGDNADGAQQAFVDESLRQGVSASDQNTRNVLYAQAAEVLGAMPSSNIESELNKMGSNGLPSVNDFVSGALNGEAQRYQSDKLLGYPAPNESGVASMLDAVSNSSADIQGLNIDDPRRARTFVPGDPSAPNHAIEQLFNASMQYFHDNAFSDNEKTLLQNDSSDNLRDAFNNALGTDFNGILRQNISSDGSSLLPSGEDNFATYSRLEFGNNASDYNAQYAQNILGNNFGNLYNSLLDAQNGDGGQNLSSTFPGLFKDSNGNSAASNAATVFGQLFGSTLNGMNDDYAHRQNEAQTSHDGAVQGWTDVGNILTAMGAVVAAANPAAGAVVAAAGAGSLELANHQGTPQVNGNQAYSVFLQSLTHVFRATTPDQPSNTYVGGHLGDQIRNAIADEITSHGYQAEEGN